MAKPAHSHAGKRITITQLARKAKVNISTVSRSLKDDPQIGHATAQKVKALAASMGYVPNQSARNLRRGRSDTVTVVVPTLGSDFAHSILKGVEEQIRKTKYRVRVEAVGRTDIHDEKAALKEVLHKVAFGGEADGLILVALGFPDENTEKLFERFSYPTVLIEGLSYWAGQIGLDNEAAGRMAAEHLLKSGRKRLALVTGARDRFRSYAQRCKGVTEAFKAARGGLEGLRVMESQAYTPEEIRALSGELAAQRRSLDGVVVAAGDPAALQIMRHLKQAGLRIPEDLALVGFDDLPESEYAGLTTIAQPLHEFGAKAAEFVTRVIEKPGETGQKRWVFQPSLVKRRSSQPA